MATKGNKRRRIASNALHITDLPVDILADAAAYLSKPYSQWRLVSLLSSCLKLMRESTAVSASGRINMENKYHLNPGSPFTLSFKRYQMYNTITSHTKQHYNNN